MNPTRLLAASPAPHLTPAVLLIVGSGIATMAGFDTVFNAITNGLPWLRAALFAALACAGFYCASRAGLSLLPKRGSASIAIALGVGAAMAFGILAVDSVIFRALVPPAYAAFIEQQALSTRLLYFITRAFNEEIFYRLLLMSAIACALHRACGDQGAAPSSRTYWVALAAAQIIAIWLNVIMPLPAITPAFALYTVVRFIFPGMVWGYLYWRHGFVTAQIAHISTHIFLQPMLGYALGG